MGQHYGQVKAQPGVTWNPVSAAVTVGIFGVFAISVKSSTG